MYTGVHLYLWDVRGGGLVQQDWCARNSYKTTIFGTHSVHFLAIIYGVGTPCH